jgi:hypothetical protein
VSEHDQAPGEPAPPPLRLVRGDATPEEIAALVAVLSAASAAGDPAPPRQRSQWASRERAVRQPLATGRGAWRASAFPR